MKNSIFLNPTQLLRQAMLLLFLGLFFASTNLQAQGVRLNGNDKVRMEIIKKESIALLNQMGDIMGRNLGRRISPVQKTTLTFGDNGTMNGVVVDPDLDDITLGYQCDPPGISTPDPCDEATSNGKPLSGSDRVKMRMIQKEMKANADAIGSIIGRTLGKRLTPVKKITLIINPDRGTMSAQIVDPELDDILLGYYCDPPGVCQENPCE